MTWNNFPMNISVNSLDKFKADVALPVIKSLLQLLGNSLLIGIFIFHFSIYILHIFLYTFYHNIFVFFLYVGTFL